MESWGQSPICTARHGPQEVGEGPFWAQRSRSQNRSLVKGGEGRGRESGNSLRVEGLAQERENGLKRRGSRKQPPQAPFSAYMRFIRGLTAPAAVGGLVHSIRNDGTKGH